jgi:D-aspartate ligase
VSFNDLPDRPPFLLTMADYYGTLAAVRCLGRAGLPVTIAESKWLAPARWSRYVTRQVKCPDPGEPQRFLEWLLEFGHREPGHVLYATSDDMLFFFGQHKAELAKSFRMFQPDLSVAYSLLNKRRLQALCEQSGIDCPETFFPESLDEVRALAPRAKFPLLIKPRTQILFSDHVKGSQVSDAASLPAAYENFVRRHRYDPALLAFDPDVVRPMLQTFHVEAAQNIYSVTGFCDPKAELFVARGAVKVLQRPRKLGIGLCFEHVPLDPALAEKVHTLCRMAGYAGAFEVEFIQSNGRLLLIDFNPRFYSQMGFDIARALPLPVFVYLAALGQEERLREAVNAARTFEVPTDAAYCHRFIFEVLLRAQGLSGKLSREEVRHWREWYASRGERVTDAVLDGADLLPSLVDGLTHLRGYARHPRAFLRTIVLDR